MNFWQRWFGKKEADLPVNLRHGRIGEEAARNYLKDHGLKFLVANYRSGKGEIDLVFQDKECVVFVEVKASSAGQMLRPASRVNLHKRKLLTKTALAYLKEIKNPRVKVRFDIVEVILKEGKAVEIRHLPNSFVMPGTSRYR